MNTAFKKCLMCEDEFKYRDDSSYCSSGCENKAVKLWEKNPYSAKFNSLEENNTLELYEYRQMSKK